MKTFKNSKRYLALALTFLMPIYANFELLAEQNKEKIEVIENINNKEEAKKEIEKLITLIKNAQDNKDYKNAIKFLNRGIDIEKNIYGEDHPYLADSYNWIGEIYLNIGNYLEAEKYFSKVYKIRELYEKENPLKLSLSYAKVGKLYKEKGDFNQSEKYLLKSLKVYKKIPQENLYELERITYELGNLYENRGLFKIARKYYKEGLNAKKNLLGEKHIDLTTSFLDLGRVNEYLGELKEAEKFYLKSLKMKEILLGENHPSTAISLIYLADLNSKKGLFKKENEYLLKAKNINDIYKNKIDNSYFTIVTDLEDLYSRKGFYNEAEKTLKRAIEITEFEDEKVLFYLSLSDLYIKKRSFKKAEENLLRALDIEQENIRGAHKNVHYILKKLGDLYKSQGLYKKAEENYLKSLLLVEKKFGLNNSFSAIVYGSLGHLYSRADLYAQGEPLIALLEKAEENYLKALDISKIIYGENNFQTKKLYEDLGYFYLIREEPKKAEDFFLKSLKLTENIFGQNHPNIAEEKVNIGFFYLTQRQFNKAESYLLESMESLIRNYGKNHLIVSRSLKTISYLYEAQSLYQKAENYALKALKIDNLLLGENQVSNAFHLNYIADLKRKNSKFVDSSLFYRKGIELQLILLQKELPFKSIKERNIFAHNIDLDIPNKIYQFTLEDKLKSEKELAMFLRLNRNGLLEEIEKRQNKLVNSPNQIKLVENIKRIKSQIAIYGSKKIDNKSLIKKLENLEKKLFNLLPELKPKIVEVGEVAKVLTKNSILVELQRFTPEKISFPYTTGMYIDEKDEKIIITSYFLKDSPAEKAGLEVGDQIISINNFPTKGLNLEETIDIFHEIKEKQINIKIKRNNLTKTYKVIRSPKMEQTNFEEDRYLALILDENENISVTDLGKADELDLLIQNALIASEEGYEDAQNIWDEISNKLFNPLRKYIRNKKIIFISPDSELNRISFSALRSPKNNKRFINEDYEIRLITTGRELLTLNQNKKSFETSFVIANPDFENNINNNLINIPKIANISATRSYDLDNAKWSSLPGSKKEGDLISSILGAELFTGRKATSNLIKNLNNFKILHIASHSYFLNDQENSEKNNNYLSYLTNKESLLGIPKSKENPLLRSGIVLAGANNPKIKNDDDGYLTALEITNLDWEGTDLVVISGCESGLGEIMSGEGVYGLKRAISVAGAKSSLLSLWKVNDLATAEFMETYYQKLKNGEGKAEALHNTQKEFRNNDIEGYRHPYYWAAFQLSGDWRPIDF